MIPSLSSLPLYVLANRCLRFQSALANVLQLLPLFVLLFGAMFMQVSLTSITNFNTQLSSWQVNPRFPSESRGLSVLRLYYLFKFQWIHGSTFYKGFTGSLLCEARLYF